MKKILTFGIASAIVGGIVYLCKSVKEGITVNHLTWERGADIEEFKEVEESDVTVPEGATVTHVATQTVKDTPDQVVKKVICYTYVVKKWVLKDHAIIAGDSTETPKYPEVPLTENQRCKRTIENYYIVDTNGNKWELDYPKWVSLSCGAKVLIKHNRFSNYISKIERY